jgi:hypothetical protein
MPGMAYYPQGWHLFFGLIDGFVRSSTDGSGLSALHHYLAYAALTYAAFALVVIWGMQRLAEPLLTPARRLALVAVSVAYLLSNDTFSLAQLHFTPQIAALALVVVLVVTLARPPARTTLSLWIVAALLDGVGFTYSLYAPPMILAVLIWLYARRRQVVRHRLVLATALVAVLLSAAPLVVGLIVAGQGRGLPAPTTAPGSVDGALLLAGIVAAAMLRSWRTARWRVLLWTTASAVACSLGFDVLLWVMTGGSGSYYYGHKLYNLEVLLLVLAVSAVLVWLPAPQRLSRSWSWRDTSTWPVALRSLAPGLSVSIALAAGSGLVFGDSPYEVNGSVDARGWTTGSALKSMPLALPRVALSETRREVAPGTFTVVMDENPALGFLGQILVSGLRRQYQDFLPSLYETPYRDPDFYDKIIENLPPGPVLIVVDTERTRSVAEQLRDRHPDRRISVAFINY